MERNISPAAILCIVLVSLAAVIGLGYGAFAITKGSANEGTQEVATQTSAASKSWKDTYDAKDVTGAQVQSLVKEAESKGIAVFINTREMSQGTINSTVEVPVLKHNGKYYMNYGTVFDYEDDSYKKTSGEISMSDNSGLLGVRDGSSLKVDYNPKLQDGKLVRHEDYTGLYTNGAVNYIDTHAKFRSNLIYGNDGEVVGVILSQVNRPGASLPSSSGGGFVNGSAGMGGTTGSYIPSHSNSGNIPLTGGGTTGGSSSGSSSYAPSTGGANAPGTSTTPSTPAPETASGEFVITFDTRGGNVIDYQKVSSGAKVTKPDAPVRTNYGFAGWYTDESCTKKFNFSTSVSKNITLYARWFMWGDVDNNGVVTLADFDVAMDYVSWVTDGMPFYLGAFVESLRGRNFISITECALISDYVGNRISSFPIETETTGYEFDLENGYYYDTYGNMGKIPVAVATDKWSISFYLTPDYLYTVETVPVEGYHYVPKPETPIREGYAFCGWYLDSLLTRKLNFDTYIVSHDIDLYAKWVKWGDVDNNGIVTVDDAQLIMKLYDFEIESVPLLLVSYVNEIPAANAPDVCPTPNDAATILGWLNGELSSLPIESKTRGYEFDLENGYYTTNTGIRKEFPVYEVSSPLGDKIPSGGTYYVGVTTNSWGDYEILDYTGGTAYTGGSQYPGEAQVGDVLVCGDYEYRFGMRYLGGSWFIDSSVGGWGVASKNWSSTELGSILTEINDYSVVCMSYTFYNSKIVKSPEIPKTVTNLDNAYDYCLDLSVPPVIPNGVNSMSRTFQGCESLKEPPVLPNTVTDLTATFYASSIKTAPNIPNSVTSLAETFACSRIETPPVIPNSVTNMYYTFASCSNLKTPPTLPSNIQELDCTFWGAGIETAPVIPASVKNMSCVFVACENLSGTVRIHANPTSYDSAFGGTVLPITLVGNSSKLAEIAATGDKGNVSVQY